MLYKCFFFFYIHVVLEISFERMAYSYVEPPEFDQLEVDDIYMLKNIETELTYRIFFQTVATDATRNLDYQSTLPAVLDFPPNQQRLQVFGGNSDLFMEIHPDSFIEGEESIQISSEPVDNPPPAYTRPQTLAVTTLFILDDDSKKFNLFIKFGNIHYNLVNPTDITVGWEQTSYTVSEDTGTFEAFYSVVFPLRIANPFFMRVTTIMGAAGK